MGVNKNFVVKNGLEVDTSLILANADTNRVGIGTSLPTHLLHVNGGIAATHISVSGVTTINSLVLTGSVSIANTSGQAYQYLRATGTGGIEWASLPDLRSSVVYTATENQIDFDYTSVAAFIDVYINGVKLTENSYTYVPGVKVRLGEPAFADDIVEIIGYTSDTVGTSTGGATIGGITVYENNTLKGIAGLVTSINFVGPTVGVTTSGYGVTVYSAGGGGGESYWQQTATGIHTTSNIGVGTTSSPNKLTVVGNASISGFTTLGIATVGTSSTQTSLYVQGGISATGVVTASYYEGDGSRLTNISAAAIDTGWINTPSVGIGTTAKVGIGTTNPQYRLEVGSFGDTTTQLYVRGGIEATSNISIGGSLTATGGIGAGNIVIDSSLINAPGLISVGGTAVRILGNLYVNGTRTETSAVDLQVSDKIVGLGTTSTPNDIGADGGGIILYGDTNKQFLWDYTNNAWTSNVNIGLSSNRSFKINGEQRLSYGLLSVPNASITGVVTATTVSAGIITAANSIYSPLYTGNGNALSGIVTSIVAGTNITISGSTGRIVINATGAGGTGGGGSNVSISDTPPASPFSGDLWYSSILGRGFIYYVDDDSSQWVDFSPNGGPQSNTVTVSNNGVPLTQAISNINFTGNVSISTSIAGIATIGINTVVIGTYTQVAGIATYATTAGIATYAVTAGIATQATYATTAGVGTYAVTAGIATYATTAGVGTYAVTAGIATYAVTSGIATQATYAITAGVATSVIGGISSVTRQIVSGISTVNVINVGAGGTILKSTVDGFIGIGSAQPSVNLDVVGDIKSSGTVTATTFVGDGSGLTGLTGVGGGVALRQGGYAVGSASTINFNGNADILVASGIATINIANYWNSSETGINTTANVGIGTTNATSTLTVKGNTSLETLSVSGVSTFGGTINANNVGAGISVKLSNSVPTYLEMLGVGNYNATLKNIYDSNSSILVHSGAVELRSGGTNNYTVFQGTIDGTGQLMYRSGAKLSSLIDGVQVNGTTFTDNLSVSGVSTLSNVVIGGATTSLIVNGDARITGILTLGTSSITLNGTSNTIGIGTTSLTESGLSKLVRLTGNTSNFANNVSVSGTVTATAFVGDGSGLTGLTAALSGIATDSDKLSGQDPCFYVNYDNLYNTPEKVWTDVNQGGVGTGVTITGIATAYTFSSPRVVSGVSTNRLTVTGHLYYPTSPTVGPEVDVVVLYHGTITSSGVTPLNSAQTFLNIATNPSQLNLRDKIIFSVAYPQDAIPDWVNSIQNPATQFSEFASILNINNFYLGDNIYHAEAALLWVKERLNTYLSTIGSGKSINRVYTLGHSQGAYLVHRLNTMHSVDGVISNAPGPIDLLDRCQGSQNTINYTCNKIRVGLGSTSVNPAAYNSRSLKSYLTGTLSPQLFTQALDDDAYQVNLFQTIVEPGINTCTEYGPIEIKYYPSGGHDVFVSNPNTQKDYRDFLNSGITGSYSFRNVGIGTTNPTSKLTVRGGDISVGVNTSHGLILTAPNGTQYRLIVANNGTLSTVAV